MTLTSHQLSTLQCESSAAEPPCCIAPPSAAAPSSGISEIQASAVLQAESERDLEPVEARLVELMRQQWLSPQDALRLAGTMSLSQRVSELKREHGLRIVDEWRQVGRSRYKVYRIAGEVA
jgi:hypothetical protein